jgi:hypothetical protein
MSYDLHIRRNKMKKFVILVGLVALMSTSFCFAQESKTQDSIFLDIGLELNYSLVNNDAYLAPNIGLAFQLRDSIMADVSFGFETRSTNFSGIQKDDNKYFTIDLLGKYFLRENIWVGAGFGYAMFLGSTTVNATPTTPGELHPDMLRVLLSTGYFSRILEGIYLDPSFLVRFNLPTEESDSFDFTFGILMTISFGIN